MGTWDEVKEMGGINLLPAGTRTYEVTAAAAVVNQHTGRRQVEISLLSSAGSGQTDITLEPWATDTDSVDLFESLLKTNAKGLGYKPSGNLSMMEVAGEFALYAEGLVGAIVEADVTHVESKKLKDDGTPFVNHRVRFKRLVSPAVAGTGPASDLGAPEMPEMASAGANSEYPF